MKSPPNRRCWLSWLEVVLCALAIFFTVPLARSITNFVSVHIGRAFFGFAVLLAAGATFIGIFYLLYVRLKIRTVNNYIWLTLVSGAYVYFTLKLWKSPEEAVHFIEYGILGFLLFFAFRHHIDDKGIYLVAFLAGSLVGIFDEIIQWIVPDRYWDFRDVGLNALSSGLCQILLWKGIRPKLPSKKIRPKSIKIISTFLAANLILIGLCFSNRSARVHNYAEIFPFLSGLKKQEAMSELRYTHKNPEIGAFFSRITLKELEQIDNQKFKEFGSFLRDWKDRGYAEFLQVVPGYTNPFLHEIRVHIFRRNKKYESAMAATDPSEKEENFFIAFKENLILEKYFRKTLLSSPYKWEKAKLDRFMAMIDTTAFYKSPVSKPRFIVINEVMMWVIILCVLIFLFVLNSLVKKRPDLIEQKSTKGNR